LKKIDEKGRKSAPRLSSGSQSSDASPNEEQPDQAASLEVNNSIKSPSLEIEQS